MKASLRLGRVLGIPVEINASWLAAFFLLTFVLARQFGESNLGWPVAQSWLLAMLMVVLFFMSVLAHELSHSVLAQWLGIPVLGQDVCELSPSVGPPACSYTAAKLVYKLIAYTAALPAGAPPPGDAA